MGWKKFKIPVAFVLAVSILATNGNVILYANASMETDSVTDEYALEEPLEEQDDRETLPEDAAPEDTESEEVEPGEAGKEETLQEEVLPEEVLPEETLQEETLLEDVDSEQIDSEERETEENETEETATDDVDDFEVDLEEQSETDSQEMRLPDNYTRVCQGGGSEINDERYNRPNWNPNGMKNQDLGKEKKYYDPQSPSKGKTLSEADWVSREYAPGDLLGSKDKLFSAVIDPGADSCYYGNPINGYGAHVDLTKDRYHKYNADWSVEDTTWSGGTPGGIVPTGSPLSTSYAGNYVYKSNGNWQNPFTLVTHSKISLENRENYYVNATGGNRNMPLIYDTTVGNMAPTDSRLNIYYFKAQNDVISYIDRYPTIVGTYLLEAQYNPDKNLFRLPEVATKEINMLPKGYQVKYTMGTEKNVDQREMKDDDWNPDQKYPKFDKEVNDKFGIQMYLENKTYEIPKPKIDETKYIFEGWTVYEEHLERRQTDSGFVYYETKIKEKKLLPNERGTYSYTVEPIGDNATYLLNSEIFAKYRLRKSFTANVGFRTIDGSIIVNGEPISITTVQKDTNDAMQDVLSHKYIESIEDNTEFRTSIQPGYGYEFVGWSESESQEYDKYQTESFKPTIEWDKQIEQDKTQDFKANYKAKPYNIVFDGNGGLLPDGDDIHAQLTSYYKNITLDENQFVREGYTFLGWSTDPKATQPEHTDKKEVYNLPIQGKDQAEEFPEKITLYAIWQSPYAQTTIEKYNDTLWIEGKTGKAVSNGVYIEGSKTSYNVYEIARYYLNVDTAEKTLQEKLDRSKFYVVWERSTDGGNSFTKINNTAGDFLTKPFTDNRAEGYGKAVYDQERKQWFVPLLVRANYPATYDNINGIYRVNVAYDDPKATVKVTSEDDFYHGRGNTGWTTSVDMEVKVVRTFETVVSIPSAVSLVNEQETNEEGSTKEVIKSAYDSNKVTVSPVEHSLTKDADYNWSTPNTAMDGKTTDAGSYNGGQYSEYTKQKPLQVSVEWDGTLQDATKSYTISNINMYSASDLGSMKKDQQIHTNTEVSFSYDGSEQEKTLFDFYLKGEKPENLPHGTTYQGIIHFKFSNMD